MKETVLQALAVLLPHASPHDLKRPLAELGLDSLSVIGLVAALEAELFLESGSTQVTEVVGLSNLDALAEFFSLRLERSMPSPHSGS